MPDPEIEAMASVADALSVLDDDTRSRVLRWAAEKYGVILPQLNRSKASSYRTEPTGIGTESDDRVDEELNGERQTSPMNGGAKFEHFAELFDAVNPKTDMEKAITAAYWEQVIRGKNEWQSHSVNRELKNLGHYVTAINKALAAGMQKKPALVLQLKKAGATQQGRKTYKLSTEGLKFVRSRITQNA